MRAKKIEEKNKMKMIAGVMILFFVVSIFATTSMNAYALDVDAIEARTLKYKGRWNQI